MNKHQRRESFRRIAGELRAMCGQFAQVRDELVLACDRWAIDDVIKNVSHTARNCEILADHQVGAALYFGFDFYFPPGFMPPSFRDRPAMLERCVSAGSSVEEINRREYEAAESSDE